MYRFLCICFIIMLSITGCAPAQTVLSPVAEPTSWPTAGWQSAAPESQGMDSVLLAQMVETILENETNIYSVLVVRHGRLVAEAYFHPYTRETRVHVQSITKSVIGMLVGRAIAAGVIKSEEETLVSFFPGRVFVNSGKQKESIRLSHLLSMTSGLDCQEFSAEAEKMEQSRAWVQFMLDRPVVSAPGKQFQYCNGNAHLLSAVLQKTTGLTAREYANQELFAPLGIPAVAESDWGVDPKGYTTGGYGLHLRPTDLAKLALLSLQGGRWEGKALLADGWMAKSATQWIEKEAGSQSGYGYLWTVYPEQDRFAALGLGGQQIHVVPAKDLIVVVTAGLPAYAEAPEIEQLLDDYILLAVKSEGPLAENSAGTARLRQAVESAANPVRPAATLPQKGLERSGSTYIFEENPFGWKQLQFVFTPGASSGHLYFNGSVPLEIGLDNLFRQNNSPLLGEVLLRGHWEDEQTFVVDYPYPAAGPTRLGELGKTEMRFQFEGDQLTVSIVPLIFGGDPFIIHGKQETT